MILLSVIAVLACFSGRPDDSEDRLPVLRQRELHERLEYKNLPFSEEDIIRYHPGFAYLYQGSRWFYGAADEDGSISGYIAYGPPYESNIAGFAGRVPLLIAFDADFHIIGVHLLPNQETPGYVRRVEEQLLDVWAGKKTHEALRLDADAVTGATQTSRAVIQGVRATLSEAVEQDRDQEFGPDAGTVITGHIPAMATFLFLLLVIFVYFSKKNSRTMRRALTVLRVVIPGVMFASMLSLPTFAGWFRGGIDATRQWLLLLLAFTAVLIPLLTGKNFYCYNFCPYGAAQDLMRRLNKKKKRKLNNRIRSALKLLRALLIAAAGVNVAANLGVDLAQFEPFAAFRWPYAPWFSRFLAVSFLAAAVFMPRLWCRLCPTGGIIEAFRVPRRTGK